MEKVLLFIGTNPLSAGYLSYSLGKAFEVIWCESAEEALGKLSHSWNPDLIICDYELKGMNGYQFLLQIKKGSFKHIPVLIITINNRQRNREMCLSVGAEDYLAKPFHATELNLKVLDILKNNDFKPLPEQQLNLKKIVYN